MVGQKEQIRVQRQRKPLIPGDISPVRACGCNIHFNTLPFMSVPSFTSFPTFGEEAPKNGDKPDKRDRRHEKSSKSSSSSRRKESERPTERDSNRQRHRERDRDRDMDRKRDQGRDSYRERDRNGRQRDEDRHRSHGTTDAHSSSLVDDSYRLFFSDRKPDRLNIQYGGLHAGDVPRYRSIYGRCLAPLHLGF